MFLLQPRRLSFGGFGTLRKKRPEDAAEYVCPMNVEMPRSSSFQTGVRMYEEHLEHLEQVPRRRLAEKNHQERAVVCLRLERPFVLRVLADGRLRRHRETDWRIL